MNTLLILVIGACIIGGLFLLVFHMRKKARESLEREQERRLAVAAPGTHVGAIKQSVHRREKRVDVNSVKIKNRVITKGDNIAIWAPQFANVLGQVKVLFNVTAIHMYKWMNDGWTRCDGTSYELECTATIDGMERMLWLEVEKDDEWDMSISWKLKGRDILQQLGLTRDTLYETWDEDEGAITSYDGKTWEYDEDESSNGLFFRDCKGNDHDAEALFAFDFYTGGADEEECISVEVWGDDGNTENLIMKGDIDVSRGVDLQEWNFDDDDPDALLSESFEPNS